MSQFACMESMPNALASLLASSRLKSVPKGQILYYEGDTYPDIHVIKSGIIKIHDIDDNGNEKVLHLLKPFGIAPFIFFSGRNKPTKWYYTTLTDSDVYIVSNEELTKLMCKDSEVATYLLNWFTIEVHEILVRLSSLSKTVTTDKLVAALKFLVVCHSHQRRGDWWRVDFPVNHQLLADMMGVARESAAMAMKELQDKKIVRSPHLTTLEIDFNKLIATFG